MIWRAATRCSFIEGKSQYEDGGITRQNYRGPFGACAFYAEADDGFLAERLGGFQPVQAVDQYETRTVRTHHSVRGNSGEWMDLVTRLY